MSKIISKLAEAWSRLYGFSFVTTVTVVSLALPARAQDIDPVAPLSVLERARTVAQNSNLNADSATSGLASIVNVLLVAFGALGLGLAGFSGYKLYQNVQDGEQARGSNGAYLIALIIGGLLTIIAVVVGAITNFATSGSAS